MLSGKDLRGMTNNVLKRCMYLTFVFLTVTAISCYAYENIDISINKGIVSFYLKLDISEVDLNSAEETPPFYPTEVTLLIKKASVEDATSADALYLNQTVMRYGDGHTFVFDFTNATSGDYSYVLTTPYGLWKTGVFTYENPILGLINSAVEDEDAEALDRVLSVNAQSININLTYYLALADKKTVLDNIIKEGPFETIDEFRHYFYQGILLRQFAEQAETENILAVMELFFDADVSNRFKGIYGFWKNHFDRNTRSSLVAELKTEYKSYNDFDTALKYKTIIKFDSQVGFYVDLGIIITNDDNIFGIPQLYVISYGNLIRQYAVLDKLHSQMHTVDSLTAFYALLDKLITDQALAESNVGGGGGKQSSGGGSSYKLSTPVQAELPSQQEIFNDLGSAEWAKEAINYLYNRGIINGYGKNTYMPERSITRAEFAHIIFKAFELPFAGRESYFTDVITSDWYFHSVMACQKSGIINGYNGTIFGAHDNITRQDMAVILYRVLQFKGIIVEKGGEYNISDKDKIADYAVDSVIALVKAGILKGHDDNSFAPVNSLSRAEAAQAIYTLLRRIGGGE